jgi:hypothetical protein
LHAGNFAALADIDVTVTVRNLSLLVGKGGPKTRDGVLG